MTYVILRLVYLVYFTGVALCIFNGVSHLIFSFDKIPSRLRYFGERVVFSFFWPVSVFSPSGRKKIWGIIEQL